MMALFTLHPLSVTLATSFSVILVTVLTGCGMVGIDARPCRFRRGWHCGPGLRTCRAPSGRCRVASDSGDRYSMIGEEAEHLPRGIRPLGVRIGSGRTPSRPSVAGAMYIPLLDHGPALAVDVARAPVAVAAGDLPIFDFGPHRCGVQDLRRDLVTVDRIDGRVTVPRGRRIVGTDAARSPLPVACDRPAPCRMARKAEFTSLAAPQARPECTATPA